MRRWLGAIAALLALPALGASELAALTYHDITPDRSVDLYGLPAAAFAEQMQYLRDRGHVPVSLALLERVRRGEATLPERAVLLTFDDGLKSFATQALPVLEKYGFPAVLGVVTAWADGKNLPADYRDKVMGWDELRRVARSPLVEIVSHTDNLHQGVRINRQGNEAPAVVARAWIGNGSIESEAQFRARVRADLTRAQQRFREELGRAVAGVVWPFGENDAVAQEEARRLGMVWQLGLEGRPTAVAEFPRIHRSVLRGYRGIADFAEALEFRGLRREQVRVVGLGLHEFAGRADTAQEGLLSEMLERVQLLRANAVIVTPFTNDGRALFPNTAVPVTGDVLSRVTHQLRSRAGIRRHLWVRIPMLPDLRDREGLMTGLARNVALNGVLFDDPALAADPAVLQLLRYYHPQAKVGGRGDAVSGADLRVIELGAPGEPENLQAWVEQQPRGTAATWFLVKRAPKAGDGPLRATLRALRRAGARDYGYGDDDYVAGAPDPAAIVSEFSGRSIVNGVP